MPTLKDSMDNYQKLKARQLLPLEMKERITTSRIEQWYDHFHGKVYVSFSGGKDSTVLLHQVRRRYPLVQAVFVDTGLEYPEIRDFVKTIDNVVWVKPEMNFRQVLDKYGYPVVSKAQARFIRDIQNPTDKNAATINLRLTGFNQEGIYCSSQILSKKWLPLAHSNIKVSEQCCDVIKKRPFNIYVKSTGNMPISGVMAGESRMRNKNAIKNGCNAFDIKQPISNPMTFWLEEDIWAYIKKYDIPYSKIYDMGEKRTGCMFCMFGVHLEKGENRFQRMKKSHPKQWDYCINKLGCGKVLDFIGVEYQ